MICKFGIWHFYTSTVPWEISICWLSLAVNPHCDQACELKLQDIDERMEALQKELTALDRRDNELLAEKKRLSELKVKKRQLEQKISTKQDR